MSDVPTNPHRQPAYDAVYAVIGRFPPRAMDSYGQARENARVWRAVEAALDAMEAVGLHLPAGTKTVEQFAARVLLDGEPVEAVTQPTTRELAERQVRAHQRERAANPGWRGTAELVRRQQHATPWEPVKEQKPKRQRDLDELAEVFAGVPIRFWMCPIDGHSDRSGPDGRPVVTVEWRGDIAYCTADDCGRNSQQTSEETP
ncbi:hypothetical protein ABZY58_11900 [Micromonospora tulbaghiae]|uniref:hypothetical protein n=1 Tax=Micromonospora tulbaghiae TaxID=479978 RepID=UPI0033AEB585